MLFLKKAVLTAFICWHVSIVDSHAFELEKRPLRFVDQLQRDIESYCVVPLYAKSYGIGLGPEATGRKYSNERYLMWPMIVKKDDAFKLRSTPQKGFAFLFIAVTYGEVLSPSEFLVLKKGYLPVFWRKYIDNTKVEIVQMVIGDSEVVLKELLNKQINANEIRRIFYLKDDTPIVNKYTDADRDVLRRCYYAESPK